MNQCWTFRSIFLQKLVIKTLNMNKVVFYSNKSHQTLSGSGLWCTCKVLVPADLGWCYGLLRIGPPVWRNEEALLLLQPAAGGSSQSLKAPQLSVESRTSLSFAHSFSKVLQNLVPRFLSCSGFLLDRSFLIFFQIPRTQTLHPTPELLDSGVSFGLWAHDGLREMRNVGQNWIKFDICFISNKNFVMFWAWSW